MYLNTLFLTGCLSQKYYADTTVALIKVILFVANFAKCNRTKRPYRMFQSRPWLKDHLILCHWDFWFVRDFTFYLTVNDCQVKVADLSFTYYLFLIVVKNLLFYWQPSPQKQLIFISATIGGLANCKRSGPR